MNSSLQQPSRRKFHCIPEVDKYRVWVMSHIFPTAIQEDLKARGWLGNCKKKVGM